jgi:hypothetical protein
MAELSKDTKFSLSIETIVTLVIAISTATGFYFSLKAQIDQAMVLPEPVISRAEYDLKDNAIRSEIMNNRELIEKNFEKLEIIEQRLYELKKN